MKKKAKILSSDLIERVVEPCCDRGRPRLDGDELAVRLVDRLAGLVEVPKIQEHLADQFVLQTMIIIILKIIGIFARLELKINQNFVLLCFR